MKTKCRALWGSLVILVVSIIITFFWQLRCPYSLYDNLYNYAYTLLIGIVSSSFVTTLIYSVEYLSAKKQSLESYALEIISILSKLLQIEYFSTTEPLNFVTQYLSEQQHNETALFQRSQVSLTGQNVNFDDEPLCISTAALKDWQLYLLEHDGLLDSALEPGVLEAENNIIDRKVSTYENQIKAIFQDYQELSTITFDKADMLIEDIQFFCDGWCSRRSKHKVLRPDRWNNIYYHIHKPIRTILNGENTKDTSALLSVCNALKKYNYGKSSLSTVMLMINDFQNKDYSFTDMNSKEQTKYEGLHEFCKVIELQIGKYLLNDFEKKPKWLD